MTLRIAVKEITGEGERKSTDAFSGLQSHYLLAAKFGRPGPSPEDSCREHHDSEGFLMLTTPLRQFAKDFLVRQFDGERAFGAGEVMPSW